MTRQATGQLWPRSTGSVGSVGTLPKLIANDRYGDSLISEPSAGNIYVNGASTYNGTMFGITTPDNTAALAALTEGDDAFFVLTRGTIVRLGGPGTLKLATVEGSFASPGFPPLNRQLGVVNYRGWGGAGLFSACGLTCFASEAWTGSAHGTKLTIAVTQNGTTTATGRFTIDNDGTIIINKTVSQIVPGATSFAIRDTANAVDNLIITNSGSVTLSGATPKLIVSNAASFTTVASAAANVQFDTGAVIVRAAGPGTLFLSRVNTSFAAPTAVVLSDQLGNIRFTGYDTTNIAGTGVLIFASALETWSGTAKGANLSIQTVAATTTVLTTRIIVAEQSLSVLTGSVVIGNNTLTVPAPLRVSLNTAAGVNRDVQFLTAGVARWIVRGADSTAEGGANAGSNFTLIALTDAGAVIDNPISITRAAGGLMTFTRQAVSFYVSSAASFATLMAPSTTAAFDVNADIARVGNPGSLNLLRVNTSYAAPTVVLNGQQLGVLRFAGYDTVAVDASAATIFGVALEDFSATARGTQLAISTVTPTTVTSVTRMTIQDTETVVLTGNLRVAVGDIIISTAVSQLRGGATSFAIRNSANTLNNLLINDGTAFATFRGGVSMGSLTATSIGATAGILDFTGVANAKIIPGSAQLAIRNALDSVDNFVFTNAGALTVAAGITITASGLTVTAGGVTITAGDLLDVAGDFKIQTAGKGIYVKEGANATMGTAVLVAGTLVVNTTKVTANSRIFLTCQVPGGTPGFLRVSARTAGTSFTILSSNAADTSTVGWIILEPA